MGHGTKLTLARLASVAVGVNLDVTPLLHLGLHLLELTVAP